MYYKSPGLCGIFCLMKKLYFTRHGQTIWNVENKICGATDIALTDLGRQQAEELGLRIASDLAAGLIHIDSIVASPLSRACDTASIIAEKTGLPMRTDERITEQNFGRYESTPRDGAEFAAQKEIFVNSFSTGESMLRVAQRVYNLLDEIKSGDKVCLIVAHNGIARIVNSYFNDMSNKEFAAFGIRNCELISYDFI